MKQILQSLLVGLLLMTSQVRTTNESSRKSNGPNEQTTHEGRECERYGAKSGYHDR